MPTISVLICTRNRSNLLRRCLISLSNQTPKPYEVIIVDNGSRDNTKEICDSFAGKMSLQYVFENHVGLPYARNAGIRLASGDVYAFIDDDCVAKRNWIRSITDHFSVNQKSVGIIGKISRLSSLREKHVRSRSKSNDAFWIHRNAPPAPPGPKEC